MGTLQARCGPWRHNSRSQSRQSKRLQLRNRRHSLSGQILSCKMNFHSYFFIILFDHFKILASVSSKLNDSGIGCDSDCWQRGNSQKIQPKHECWCHCYKANPSRQRQQESGGVRRSRRVGFRLEESRAPQSTSSTFYFETQTGFKKDDGSSGGRAGSVDV